MNYELINQCVTMADLKLILFQYKNGLISLLWNNTKISELDELTLSFFLDKVTDFPYGEGDTVDGSLLSLENKLATNDPYMLGSNPYVALKFYMEAVTTNDAAKLFGALRKMKELGYS